MSVEQLKLLLSASGWLHFLQLPAMAFFPRHVLRFRSELGKLSPVSQRASGIYPVAPSRPIGSGVPAATEAR